MNSIQTESERKAERARAAWINRRTRWYMTHMAYGEAQARRCATNDHRVHDAEDGASE